MVWPITARLPCLLGADVSRQPRASQSEARALTLPQCPSVAAQLTAASRTPPWLPSEWGCRGRRLSTGRRSPDKRCVLWRCHQRGGRHAQGRDGPELRPGSFPRYLGGRGFSGPLAPPLRLVALADKLGRERKQGRERGVVEPVPTRAGGRLEGA